MTGSIIIYRSQREADMDAVYSQYGAEMFVGMVTAFVFFGIAAVIHNVLSAYGVGNNGFKMKVSLAVSGFAATAVWFWLSSGI